MNFAFNVWMIVSAPALCYHKGDPGIRRKGCEPMENSAPDKITPAYLTDRGICPTCYNRTHNWCFTGDESGRTVFENERFKCVLIHEPRADGHAVVVSQEHYKDMMSIPDELCGEMYVFAKKAMIAIKKVYGAESVYLCTMCDGPMNHFHIQLIPRYDFEKRGSRNFVKERKAYQEDKEKIEKLRELLRPCNTQERM